MSPIHDQTYRRYAGHAPAARPRLAGDSAERRPGVLARRRSSSASCSSPGCRSSSAPSSSTSCRRTRRRAQIVPVIGDDVSGIHRAAESLRVLLITVFVGAGLIATDRRANALQIYLSKPLLRTEYIAGKLGILVTFLSFVTLLPGLLLVLMQIMFSGSLEFVRAEPVRGAGDRARRAGPRRRARRAPCWRCRRCRRARATSR